MSECLDHWPFNRKLKPALKCTVWSQCTPVPDSQTDRWTNIMPIARRFVLTNASRAKNSDKWQAIMKHERLTGERWWRPWWRWLPSSWQQQPLYQRPRPPNCFPTQLLHILIKTLHIANWFSDTSRLSTLLFQSRWRTNVEISASLVFPQKKQCIPREVYWKFLNGLVFVWRIGVDEQSR